MISEHSEPGLEDWLKNLALSTPRSEFPRQCFQQERPCDMDVASNFTSVLSHNSKNHLKNSNCNHHCAKIHLYLEFF